MCNITYCLLYYIYRDQICCPPILSVCERLLLLIRFFFPFLFFNFLFLRLSLSSYFTFIFASVFVLPSSPSSHLSSSRHTLPILRFAVWIGALSPISMQYQISSHHTLPILNLRRCTLHMKFVRNISMFSCNCSFNIS